MTTEAIGLVRRGARFSLLIAGCLALSAAGTYAQKAVERAPGAVESGAAARATPAYAEVLLRMTELRAELESLLIDYTEDFPKIKEARQAVAFLEKEKSRLLAVPAKESNRLTLALGRIQVRKVEAEVEHWRLQQSLADGHPDVKRARKKVEIFEAAIKEILG